MEGRKPLHLPQAFHCIPCTEMRYFDVDSLTSGGRNLSANFGFLYVFDRFGGIRLF